MTGEDWLDTLAGYQQLLLHETGHFTGEAFKQQFHPDLSPAGWHLGHCLFTEQYWLQQILPDSQSINDNERLLYIPELSPKSGRGGALPDLETLSDRAVLEHSENQQRFKELLHKGCQHTLLRNHFLLDFLSQHYAQHIETVAYIRIQQQLQSALSLTVSTPLSARPVNKDCFTIKQGRYAIGNTGPQAPYDNERPHFEVELAEFQIARHTVSNAEFLSFIEADGYATREYWSDGGWSWRQQTGTTHPQPWRRDENSRWYGCGTEGVCELSEDEPVFGINYYEAGAFANWAGGRLPHEYEWEAAKRQDAFIADGRVWEWCVNGFRPYSGFAAYPYDGYSLPYFDGRHYVLRGSSIHTQDVIRRATFRNYYQAEKRHPYAGLRLVFDS